MEPARSGLGTIAQAMQPLFQAAIALNQEFMEPMFRGNPRRPSRLTVVTTSFQVPDAGLDINDVFQVVNEEDKGNAAVEGKGAAVEKQDAAESGGVQGTQALAE